MSSKLPKISAHNSEALKNALGWVDPGPENVVYPQIKNSNAPKRLTDDQATRAETPEVKSRRPDNSTNTNFGLLINETKLNELETKLMSLEQQNHFLVEKLKNSEKIFDDKLGRIIMSTEGERESRQRIERFINLLNEQNSVSSQETQNKLTLLQDIIEREEKFKLDQRERDLELYKNLFNTLTAKVSETVKLEIDARFQADMDNKSLAHTIAQKLMNEIDLLKREIDKSSKDTKDSLKVNNVECSDRAHNLSKYIDSQITGNNEGLIRKYDNMKTLMSKLTDQFKSHIVFHDEQLKAIQSKLKINGDTSSSTKDELMNYTYGIEERFQKKFKDLTYYLETIWKANIAALNERMDSLSNKTDKNFTILSQDFVDMRKVFANRIDEIDQTQVVQFKTLVEDLESVTTKMKNYDILLDKFEKNNEVLNKKVETNIADIVSKVNTWQTNDKVAKNIAHQELLGEVDRVREDLIQFSQQVENNMAEILKNFEMNYLSLFEKSKQTVEQINKMSENNFQIFREFDENVINLQEETKKIDINNLMNSMLDKIEQENIVNFIDSVKKDNAELSNGLDKKIGDLEQQLREMEIKGLLDDMINKVEMEVIDQQLKNSGNEENEKFLISKITLLDNRVNLNADYIDDLRKELKETKDNLNENLQRRVSLNNNEENNNAKINELIHHYESKILLDQMLNKLEFDNVYNLLSVSRSTGDGSSDDISLQLQNFNDRLAKIDNEIHQTTATTKKVLNEYNGVIDSKVSTLMERLKKENLDMWTNSLQVENKVNSTEEIRKILKKIPPVIIPREESKKMISELEATLEPNPRPKLISPWAKILNYTSDFRYDVLNKLKDPGLEELNQELTKKKANDNKKKTVSASKGNSQSSDNNKSGNSAKGGSVSRDASPEKAKTNQPNATNNDKKVKDESKKEETLKKKTTEEKTKPKVEESKEKKDEKKVSNNSSTNLEGAVKKDASKNKGTTETKKENNTPDTPKKDGSQKANPTTNDTPKKDGTQKAKPNTTDTPKKDETQKAKPNTTDTPKNDGSKKANTNTPKADETKKVTSEESKKKDDQKNFPKKNEVKK